MSQAYDDVEPSADRLLLVCRNQRAELGQMVRKLQAEVEQLRRENICDACCGKGNPGTGKPCVCGGTGMASRQAAGFRESINELHGLREQAERDAANLRQRCEALEADKVRLDFIEHSKDEVAWRNKSWAVLAGEPSLQCLPVDPKGKPYGTFATLREALDAAISAQPHAGCNGGEASKD